MGFLVKKFELYHSAQSWFAKNTEIYLSGRFRALEILCQKCKEVMEIDRVGIWFFDDTKEMLVEELTYIGVREITRGTTLKKNDYPIYFSHLKKERVVASEDTFNDPTMKELLEGYMRPLSVHALLDCPVFSDGEMIGVVCLEQTHHPRLWDIQDKNFATIFSDFVARIIESEKRHSYEKDLHHRINYLEKDLNKKLDDLREAKLSLDLAIEGAQLGKWDWDLKNNKLTLNNTWYTKLGFEFHELPPTMETFKSRIHPSDYDFVMKEVEEFISGRSPSLDCRYRMITKSGDIQWCLDRGQVIQRDKDGHILRVVGININVTPLVQWEKSLSMSERQLKSMIQSLPTPVAMFDRELNYLAFSSKWVEEWESINPIKEKENVRKLFRSDWIRIMERSLKGESFGEDESLVNLGNGKEFWLRWVVRPWKNMEGDIGGVIVMAENISAKKNAEIKLTHASKLSALGEVAGGIAHEINNPLSIIKGYIDLLKRHSKRNTLGSELLQQYISKMDDTVERISRIISGMRRFARESSADEKEKYSLNKIIEETLDICQERINNQGTKVEVEYLDKEPIVWCRPVEISQVFLNLINNSFYATTNYPHPWIKIKIKDLDQLYQVKIVDCGEKIPHSIQKKLFQPFFTTKDIGVGTGLGLSISRGIIEEHGGRLYYDDSAINTTFILELPKYIEKELLSYHQ